MAEEFGRGFVTGAGKRDTKRGRSPEQISPVQQAQQQPQQQFDPYAPDTINLYQTGPSAPKYPYPPNLHQNHQRLAVL